MASEAGSACGFGHGKARTGTRMSTNEQLASLLPYLRRFARALTGSQVIGDAYVAEALTALIEGTAPKGPARIMLYRALLTRVNASIPTLATAPGAGHLGTAERNLAVLTPMARQAFLLVAMEQFTVDDVAVVLEITTDDVSALLREASDDISAQLSTHALIIEDEPLIALDLEMILNSLGHRVERVARTEQQALDAVREKPPGLILADIQLADGSSGLDAVREILSEVSVPVIFITAYPERLLTGTKPEPTFMIRKPYHQDAVRAVVSQALFFGVAPAA
jgi:CheY-like chemotaxis protein/DNA-directed RNA polymerase specialized sigma24 family protein